MLANVLQPAFLCVLDGFGHDVESMHFIAEFLEFDEIPRRPHSAFHQDARRRKVFCQQPRYQLSFGDVPPIRIFEFNQLVEMAWIHGRRWDCRRWAGRSSSAVIRAVRSP